MKPTSPSVISVLLPTRGRPLQAQQFLETLFWRAECPDAVQVVLYVDEDDETAANLGHAGLSITRIVGPRFTMGSANSTCLAGSTGEIVMLANDDLIVESDAWDTQLRQVHERFSDGVYLAWVNDRFKRRRMSTFPVLSRTVCDLLGEPYPPAYRSAFIDYELFDIFTRLRRLGHNRLVYLDDVVFEHRHHRLGKRGRDATAQHRRRFEDDWTFLARRDARQAQATRLRALIEGTPASPIPEATEPAETPAHAISALGAFAEAFLTDRGLPLRRRAYLFTWYCGRYAAARKMQGGNKYSDPATAGGRST